MRTEKEKAAAGELYQANKDAALQAEWKKAKQYIYEYNLLPPDQEEERRKRMQAFLGKMGEECTIVSPFYCDYGYNIEIGDCFFSNMNLVILDGAKVTIGNNVFIAPNAGIYTAGHPLETLPRREGLEYAYPVTIGNDVWIGAQACILPGVTIGDRSVIGAGSVVTKDIPSDVLAAGNPCRIIRRLDAES